MPSLSPALAEAVVLAGVAGVHAAGTARLWRAHGIGRVVRRWQADCFLLGIATAAAVTLGPYDEVADRSVAGHMGQHVVLMVVCGPLLALGRPLEAVRGLLPAGRARRTRRAMAGLARRGTGGSWAGLAALAVIVHTTVMLGWHVPVLYEAAVRDEWLHGFEHVSMTAAAAGLWWVLLGAGRPRPAPGSILALFAANLPMTLLGFALLVARTPWYRVYGTGLDDQQAAGVLLWGVGGAVVVVEAVVLFGWWLAGIDRDVTPSAGRSGSSAAVVAPTGSPPRR